MARTKVRKRRSSSFTGCCPRPGTNRCGKVISAVGTIMTIAPKIAGVINTVKGVFAALNAVMLANPIILIIAAIAALVAAFIYLWNTNEVAVAVWNAIKTVITTVVNGIKSTISGIYNTVKMEALIKQSDISKILLPPPLTGARI